MSLPSKPPQDNRRQVRVGTAVDYRRVAALICLAAFVVGVSLARAATNNITTGAGTGTPGYNGDGIPATTAQLAGPVAVAALPDGGYLITDQGNSRIRRVSPEGVITTVAGNGVNSFGGDGGPATDAQISVANGVVATADGGFLIADSNNHRVRRVGPDGIISTVAGTGGFGYNGDNQPAAQALLNFPAGVAARPDGSFLIADNDNNRIREVSASGTITTVAGDGTRSFGGDNGPATSAQLSDPSGVSLTPDGGFLITDKDNNRIRKVAADGTITTVAGTGTAGGGGDGGPATAADLSAPIGVASIADGGFLIAELSGHRVRRVLPDGTITTVAGTGSPGFGGDDGPAAASQLNTPIGVDVTTGNDFLIADTGNQRVRIVDAGDPPPTTPGPPVLGSAVNVSVVRGTVLVAVAGTPAVGSGARAAQKGLTFVPLTEARQIPVGSFLDTKRGTVRLESATPRRGRTQAGQFSGGLFQVRQSRRRAAKGLTDLRLKGGSFKRCAAGRTASVRSSLSRRRIRRLRGNATGRFRTSGQRSSATVRGTVWTVTDRCDGTLTRVTRGRVVVRDFRLRRKIALRAGKSYLARAPR
jgi:NHL repeat